jgi:hypothetical protein
MKQPEDVQLSQEEGEALLARLEANTLTTEDRRVLGKVLTSYFWLLFALREAKLSLKRIKALVFGEKPKPPKPPSADGTPSRGNGGSVAKFHSQMHCAIFLPEGFGGEVERWNARAVTLRRKSSCGV